MHMLTLVSQNLFYNNVIINIWEKRHVIYVHMFIHTFTDFNPFFAKVDYMRHQ